MEHINPFNEAVDVLTKAYNHFNATLINGALKTIPVLVIMSRGNKKCYGWHWAAKWTVGTETRPEINIAAETLNRPVDQILETLIHEMAHMINAQKGISDCTPMQYHNKHFKEAAIQLGLKVEKLKMKGFALTSLDSKAQKEVDVFIAANTTQVEVFSQFVRLAAKSNYKKMFNKELGFCLCHRLEERSIKFLGLEKYFCSRCLGILLGGFFGAILKIIGIKFPLLI